MHRYFLITWAGIARAVTVTQTVTSWVAPRTQTIRHHPCDVLLPGTIGTVIDWPFSTTSTVTAGCVTQSAVYPAEVSPEPTTTVTVTVKRSSTVYETRFDRPGSPVTRPSNYIVTKVESTGRTLTSTKCTNTFVVSYYSTTPRTVTKTVSRTYTWATLSSKCMTTTTRWSTIPGVSFPYSYSAQPTTRTTAWLDPVRFSDTTILTRSAPMSRTVTETFSTDTMTYTTEICDNPSEQTIQIYFTRTIYVSTSEIFSLRTNCPTTTSSSKPLTTSTSLCTATYTTTTPSPLGSASPSSIVLIGPAASELAALSLDKRQMPTGLPVRTPIETHPVTVTTTGVFNGTTATFTRTGVAETYLLTFTTVQMMGSTVTGTDTVVRWVCEIPKTALPGSGTAKGTGTGTGSVTATGVATGV